MPIALGRSAQPSGRRTERGECKAEGAAGRSPVPAASGLPAASTAEEARRAGLGGQPGPGPAPGAAPGTRAAK